jgi:hypothetical protein
VSLKTDIERELSIPVSIHMGGPGSLNVLVDGEKIFSHQESRQRPQSAEIIAKLRALALPRS